MCQLSTAPGLTHGRINQDGLNKGDKCHMVQCACEKIKPGLVRLSIQTSSSLLQHACNGSSVCKCSSLHSESDIVFLSDNKMKSIPIERDLSLKSKMLHRIHYSQCRI